jgi:hypothetical protein
MYDFDLALNLILFHGLYLVLSEADYAGKSSGYIKFDNVYILVYKRNELSFQFFISLSRLWVRIGRYQGVMRAGHAKVQ